MVTDMQASNVWQRYAQVPHRAFFTAGLLALLTLAVWWSVALPLAGVTALPASMVHGVMMPLGIFPPFMLGFLFTAGPRWLATPPPRGHLPLAVAQVLGLILTLTGFSVGGHWPVPGLFVLLAVWWRATWLWFACIARAPAGDQHHARALLGAMVVGNVALLAVIGWVLSGDGVFWLLAQSLVLWGWIVPVFLTVSHRMVPFFTQAVVPERTSWRPMGLLTVWLAACAAMVLAAVLDLSAISAVAAVVLSLSTGLALWYWTGGFARHAWGGNRLLAMLHLSFAWLPCGFLLLALGKAELAVLPVGSAPLHAIGMGFCATMLVGFVTRVSLGHSGLPLQAGDWVWRVYLGLHMLAVLRVVLALVNGPVFMLHAIAVLWLLLIVAWAGLMLPLYWRPRADGQPG